MLRSMRSDALSTSHLAEKHPILLWLFDVKGGMASFTAENTASDVDSFFEASKILKNMKKSKKPKKERKDKSKSKRAADIMLQDVCHETATFTQMHESKKRKKAKKNKLKLEEDFQLIPHIKKPKSEKQLKRSSSGHDGVTEDACQIQPVICISPDQVPAHSSKRSCQNKAKEIEKNKSKKRVVFNLPLEQNQAYTTKDVHYSATSFPRPACSYHMSQGKQFMGESSLESQTAAEEINSQDLFITQKSFSDPYVILSSSASGNEITALQEDRSCRFMAEASTQTENFFTIPELSTSFRFQQKTSLCTEEPVDLSLPNRVRQSPNLSAKHPAVDCVNPPKPRISDTDTSEDGDTAPKSKGDLSQLKVIQTRLNESFFFKVKGYDSPKPVCPIMKLTESTDKKTKK